MKGARKNIKEEQEEIIQLHLKLDSYFSGAITGGHSLINLFRIKVH